VNPSVEAQQRRVVNALVRRNMQGWGRGLGAVFFIIHQVLLPTNASFLLTVLTFLVLLSFAFCLSFLFTHLVPFFRARSGATIPVSGKIEAVVCDPQEYSVVARGDYHFITLRPKNGPLRAYAVEASQRDDICTRRGQQVTLDVIPGIDRVERIR
jgi:uncharacterized protein (DUF58 family)